MKYLEPRYFVDPDVAAQTAICNTSDGEQKIVQRGSNARYFGTRRLVAGERLATGCDKGIRRRELT